MLRSAAVTMAALALLIAAPMPVCAGTQLTFVNSDTRDADCFVNDTLQGVASAGSSLTVGGLPAGQAKVHASARDGSGTWGPRFLDLGGDGTATFELRTGDRRLLSRAPLAQTTGSSSSGGFGCSMSPVAGTVGTVFPLAWALFVVCLARATVRPRGV
jgi:hypothetical protein